MTPKDLMNEKKLSVLEEAARKYENKERFVLDREYTRESVINAFIAGAEWQRNNMWISVEEFGYPPYDKKCEIDKRERYLLRVVSGSISPTVSYKIGYLAREDRFVGEMDWRYVTHWMPIPEFNIKT